MLSERGHMLLVKVINSNCRYTLHEMASVYEVSNRTIRNDVVKVNEFLSKYQLPNMYIVDGYLKFKEQINLSQIQNLISQADDFYEYRLSKEERIIFTAAMLISACDFITYETIANQLYVSRSTIIHDVAAVKAMMKENGCKVKSFANKGLLVQGKEKNKRILLLNLLFSGINSYSSTSYPYHMLQNLDTDFGSTLDDKVILNEIVTKQEGQYQLKYEDSSFDKMICYLIIMIRRIKKKCFIKQRIDGNQEKLDMAKSIVSMISQRYQISIPDNEIHEFSIFLNSLRATGKNIGKNRMIVDIQMLTRKFIERISEELKIDLTDDFEFFQNLSFHFEEFFKEPMMPRASNPLVAEIMETYPSILDVVHHQIAVFEHFVKRKTNESEISYIVIHICAAIERKQNQNSDLRVVVVTNVGPGPSQMLQVRLKNTYNFHIKGIIRNHDIINYDFATTDLVISTVPIHNFHCPYVLVNPLLSDEDYVHIGQKINEIRKSGAIRHEDTIRAHVILNAIEPIIHDYQQRMDFNLYERIREVVLSSFKEDKDAPPYLYTFLPESHIQLDVHARNWEEAVRISATPLLTFGYIHASYIEALIENIQENGTYVVVAPYFAVPHESYDKGCNRAGMNFIRLVDPVMFGEGKDACPVRFITTLCTTDRTIHLKAFFHLVNMLKNEEFYNGITNAQTPMEVVELIKKHEQTLKE